MLLFFSAWKLALPAALGLTLVYAAVLYGRYTKGQTLLMALLWFVSMYLFINGMLQSFLLGGVTVLEKDMHDRQNFFSPIFIASLLLVPQALLPFLLSLLYRMKLQRKAADDNSSSVSTQGPG